MLNDDRAAIRYCKACGLGPREWQECEDYDCDVETQEEADARATLNEIAFEAQQRKLP